jgi:hypothetical protein
MYVLKGTKKKPERAQQENQNPPPSPMLSSSFFIKISPCRKELVIMILCCHSYGNVVAWGHNMCVQQCSQNCEFAASSGEN